VNLDEWKNLIVEEVIEDAIADASEEVLDGMYSQFQLSEIIDRTQLIQTALTLLALTYFQSAKNLPGSVAETLIQLPGGQDWINRKN
jgi:hypothetical protein